MVGVRKVPEDLESITANCPVLKDLLQEYYVVEISGEGAMEHTKAGLSKDKVLIKAYGKRQEEATDPI
jgi:hypothetical protein